jgi:hypothetical protein
MTVATVVIEPKTTCESRPGSLEQRGPANVSSKAQMRKKSKTRPTVDHLLRTLKLIGIPSSLADQEPMLTIRCISQGSSNIVLHGRIAGRNRISELLNSPSSVLQKRTRCTSSSICSRPISSLRNTSLTNTRPLCQLMSPLLFTQRVWNVWDIESSRLCWGVAECWVRRCSPESRWQAPRVDASDHHQRAMQRIANSDSVSPWQEMSASCKRTNARSCRLRCSKGLIGSRSKIFYFAANKCHGSQFCFM